MKALISTMGMLLGLGFAPHAAAAMEVRGATPTPVALLASSSWLQSGKPRPAPLLGGESDDSQRARSGKAAGQDKEQRDEKKAKQRKREKQNLEGEASDEAIRDVVPPGVAALAFSEPNEVELGEPMRWTLVMEYPAGLQPVIPETDLGLGTGFAVLEFHGVLGGAHPEKSGTRLLEASWTVVALEPVETSMPSFEVPLGELETSARVRVQGSSLKVSGILQGRNADYRPVKGFRPADRGGETEASRLPLFLGGAAILIIGMSMLGLWIERRRRKETRAEIDPLARLELLEDSIATDLPSLQALFYALTAHLRESVDRHTNCSQAGLTDTEWIDALRRSELVPQDVGQALGNVLKQSEAVKYARSMPSTFAVKEAFESSRRALEGLENPSAPKPESVAKAAAEPVSGSKAGSAR